MKEILIKIIITIIAIAAVFVFDKVAVYFWLCQTGSL